MTDEDWSRPEIRAIGMLLLGRAGDEVDFRGRSVKSDTLLFWLNAGVRSLACTLPKLPWPGLWRELVNTARPGQGSRDMRSPVINLVAHSCLLLAHVEGLE